MRRLDAATVLLLALCVYGLLSGLGRFPALTSDEAWLGLYSGWLSARGLYTPHEMNTYTGPLFGLAVSHVFARFGTGMRTLRLFGAVANVLAMLMVALQLRRRCGPAAAAWWALALTACAYLLIKPRLAWECYALQPILLSMTLIVLDGRATATRAFLLSALCAAGALNHFIYLSIPLSLCALYAARAELGEAGAADWLRAALAALGAGAVLFLVKPRLSEAAWPAERVWAVPLFFSLPALSAASFAAGPWERTLLDRLPRRAAATLAALGLAAFALWHGPALWQIFAGPKIWMRTIAWEPPFWFDAPLWAWSSLLLAVAAWRAVRAWHDHARLEPFETTLALWPAAYAAIFILFRNTSSQRYYSLIQFLTLASAAAGLARLARPDRRWALALGVAAALLTQGRYWTERASPGDRRPLAFKNGWHSENSWDFARKEALFSAYDASGACGRGDRQSGFISVPLGFYRIMTGPRPCDPARVFTAAYCRDCARAPFYVWETTPR